jgi:hypothetical protein
MKQIRNMRELELRKQNLNDRMLYLEDKLKISYNDAMWAVTGWFKGIAFVTGMKMMLGLFFNRKKKKKG